MFITLFNLLSLVTALGVLGCLGYARRLRFYIPSNSWTVTMLAWTCFVVAQIGGLVNVYFYGGGVNWLSLVNSVVRLTGVALFLVSYMLLEKTLKNLLKKIQAAFIEAKAQGVEIPISHEDLPIDKPV